uniref:Uncharacterized protein n=1 Tax=Anopheles quadriannulatus TaxID=34691 RepID=A0A182XQD7_ANOQN
MRRTSSKRSGA